MYLCAAPLALSGDEDLLGFDLQTKILAQECRDELIGIIEKQLTAGKLTTNQLFDSFYIPIPKTDPPQFYNQFDRISDALLQDLYDRYLKKNIRFVYVIAMDKNGFVPTHNSIYSIKPSGDRALDITKSRNNRIFSDRVGMLAGRNTEPCLIQKYNRDSGGTVYDLSVPVFIRDRHWGCIRIGYN